MGKQSVAVASDAYLRLRAFVEQLPPGAVIEYSTVERALGIPMGSAAQRQTLRRAITRSKRECSVIVNVGYQLADETTAMPILTRYLVRIDRSVKRGDKGYKNMEEQFYDRLTPDEQKNIRYIGSIFGAIRVSAENGRKLYHQPRPALAPPSKVIDITI